MKILVGWDWHEGADFKALKDHKYSSLCRDVEVRGKNIPLNPRRVDENDPHGEGRIYVDFSDIVIHSSWIKWVLRKVCWKVISWIEDGWKTEGFKVSEKYRKEG